VVSVVLQVPDALEQHERGMGVALLE
jgi:hypothetical protein